MIEIVKGDLFESGCHGLVNPINCVGVMGKGLALQFKRRWPAMFVEYQKSCRSGLIEIGIVWMYPFEEGKWILNFPTKDHWRNPSRIEYIEKGLENLKKCIQSYGIPSIAIPALGCGLGELSFPLVKAKIKLLGDALPDVQIKLYEPR